MSTDYENVIPAPPELESEQCFHANFVCCWVARLCSCCFEFLIYLGCVGVQWQIVKQQSSVLVLKA